jgi:uncharacterized protein
MELAHMDGGRRTFIAATLASIASPSASARTDQTMTQHIQRALETYAAAWMSGELAAITECYHDDFTLHYFGRNGLSGDHAGKTRALRVLGEFSRRTRRRLLAIVATMAGEARGSIIAREQLHRDQETIEVNRVLVYAVEDGLLRECWIYDEDQRLIDEIVGATPLPE